MFAISSVPGRRVLIGVMACLVAGFVLERSAHAKEYEVWLVDQSNSVGTFGGRIYVWNGLDLEGEDASEAQPADVIDLGRETTELCVALTGVNPVRPHMLFFNATHSHAVLSFVASGHVVVFDTERRQPVAAIRTAPGAGGVQQAHAAVPSPDNSGILVCNQNGKQLEWIDTDYAANGFVHRTDKTLALFPLQSADLPDNAPICAAIDSTGRHGFVTLRGGGLAVVDVETTPMNLVAVYDRNVFAPVGCGTLQIGNWMWINSGGGLASKLDGFDVYRIPLEGLSGPITIPPNPSEIEWLFTDGSEHRDAHGMVATKHDRYAWVFDRAANVAEIFEGESGLHVNTVQLAGAGAVDPTPDLADISPSGNRIFTSLRGPNPLSGDPHASTGSSPGLGIIQVTKGGRSGFLKDVVRISNVDAGGAERADGHGVRVRVK